MTNYRWLLVVWLSFVSTFGWAQAPCEKPLTPSDTNAVEAHVIGSLLPMGEMRTYLEQLTGVKPLESGYFLKDRNSPENRAIARLQIARFVRHMGYQNVAIENFNGGANVVVEIPGTTRDHEVLEVTAHYDSVVTGGDDNGSGVGLLLGMLSLIRNCEHERRLRFVFMDLEEQGMHGSEHHTRKIRTENSKSSPKFVGALVVDTIGWAHPQSKAFLGVLEVGDSYRFGRGYAAQTQFAKSVLYVYRRIGLREGLLISPELEGAMPGTTDLGSYWKEGLPAVLLAAAYEPGFVNPQYHRAGDTLANMNWDYYQRMARLAMEMTAYVSGMRLKDSKFIRPEAWKVAEGLEHRSPVPSKSPFESPVNRDLALEPQYQTKFGIKDFDDEPESTLKSTKKRRKKSKPKAPPESAQAEVVGNDLVRAAQSVENADLNLVFFETARGVLAAGNQILEFEDLPQMTVKILKHTVHQRGGGLYRAQWMGRRKVLELRPRNVEKFLTVMSIPLRLRYAESDRLFEGNFVTLIQINADDE